MKMLNGNTGGGSLASAAGVMQAVSNDRDDEIGAGSSSMSSSSTTTNVCNTPEEPLTLHFPPNNLRTGRARDDDVKLSGFNQHHRQQKVPLTFLQNVKRFLGQPDLLVHPLAGLSKYVKALFVLYIFVSLLYTLAHFFALFQNNFYANSSSLPMGSTVTTGGILVSSSDQQHQQGSVVGKILIDSQIASSGDNYAVIATSSDAVLFEEVSDSLLFSKMFQYALQPTKVIPYFFRMATKPDKADITITTIITLERLQVLNNLINKYRGPISVAVHIDDDDQKLQAIEQLHYFHKTNPFFSQYVDLHLVIDKFDRQFNYWRNVARFFARTDLIMTVDVDFLLCSDLRLHYEALSDEHKRKLNEGKAVFVVPAFEFTGKAAEMDVVDYPAGKDELHRFIETNEIVMFHHKWRRGHGPTNYEKWFQTDEAYMVTEYNYNYEPYVLMKRDKLPWCDERFVGYGSNKAACLYEIFLAGVEFWVMPQDFLIHQRHPYPENDRRVERKYNKRLYDAYREEACFRYARMYEGIPESGSIDERICGANLPSFYGLV